MIEEIVFTNIYSDVIDFQSATIATKEFTPEVAMRRSSRPKMQTVGTWPAFSYPGEMLIHQEGDLLFDTPAAYASGRMDLLNKLLPNPAFVQSQRRLGTLSVLWAGFTETVEVDVCVDGHSFPIQALGPTYSPYQITWVCFEPYMIGSDTGTKYYVG